MKLHFEIFILMLFSQNVKSQANLFGEYKETSSKKDVQLDSAFLKLNCDLTFIRGDTIAIVSGKWQIDSENQITLLLDSIHSQGRSGDLKGKVKYSVKNNQISLKEEEYSKKEFEKTFKRAVKRYGWKKPSRAEIDKQYEENKERELSKFFEKIISFECK